MSYPARNNHWRSPSYSNLLQTSGSPATPYSPDYYSESWIPTSPPQHSREKTLPHDHINLALPNPHAQRPTGLFKGFERPDYGQLFLHFCACAAAYPLIYLLTLIARERSLFMVRVIVALGATGVGFCLALSLVTSATKYLEATTWATVIHFSHNGDGMRLKNLAENSEPSAQFIQAAKLLWTRLAHEHTARNSRRSFDKRPWSLVIIWFMLLMILSPALPFILGRVITIETVVRNQRKVYEEVSVTGDLSVVDISQASAQLGAFSDFIRTWTLAPFGRSAVTTVKFSYKNDTVYFAQANSAEFYGKHGLGTFELNGTSTANMDQSPNSDENLAAKSKGSNGNLLRFAQWGIRIHCEKLPDPQINLLPVSPSSFTYAFITQSFLHDLLATFELDLPESLKKPNLAGLDKNDTLPVGIEANSLSHIVKWYNNGVAHSFHTRTIKDLPDPSQGWTTIETVLVRLNSTLAPLGRFPLYGPETIIQADGQPTRIGYDVAVCVERYEPWIVETYNSTIGSPKALRIVEQGGKMTNLGTERMKAQPINSTFTRLLNSTDKSPAFFVAHDNSVNQMVKDNGQDSYYVPSPTTVSFTDGVGPVGYTELSASHVAAVRGAVDAANVLPFLVGSGAVVARSYEDQTVAFAKFVPWQLAIILGGILLIGLIAGIFVPVLPLDIPRRGFGLYSWVALLKSQELRVEVGHELNNMMQLEEVEQKLGDKKVKFVL